MKIDVLDSLDAVERALLDVLGAAYMRMDYALIDAVATHAGGERRPKSHWQAAARSLAEKDWVEREGGVMLTRTAEPILRRMGVETFRSFVVAFSMCCRGWSDAGREVRLARLRLEEERWEDFEYAVDRIDVGWLVDWTADRPELVARMPDRLRALVRAILTELRLLEVASLTEDPARAALLAGGTPETDDPGLRALMTLRAGDAKAAAKQFAAALTALRKRTRDRDALLPWLEGVFCPLALYVEGSSSRRKQAGAQINRRLGTVYGRETSPFGGHRHLLAAIDGDAHDLQARHPLGALVEGLLRRWSERPLERPRVEAAATRAERAGWSWIAAELRHVLGGPPPPGLPGLLSLRDIVPAWEARLRRIEEAVAPPRSKAAKGKQKRIAWTLAYQGQSVQLSAREQVLGAKGWSVGRPVAPSRLSKGAGGIQSMKPQDLRIAASIQSRTSYGWRTSTWFGWKDSVWEALVGHPALFDPDGNPIRVEHVEPRIVVERRPDGIEVSIRPPVSKHTHVVELEGAGFEITRFTSVQRGAGALLEGGLQLPPSASGRLDQVLEALGAHFDVGAGRTQVDGDPTPVVRLWPEGAGLRSWLGVQPAPGAPRVSPGEGAEVVLTRIDGSPVRVRRDLDLERERAAALEARCPAFSRGELVDDLVRSFPDAETALALLEELVAAEATMEWPEGGRIELKAADRSSLRVQVRAQGEWFEPTGELHVEGGRVLDFKKLLATIRKTEGRFLRLDDGTVLALSAQLRRQLDAVARAVDSKGRLHPLAAEVVEPVLDGGDEAWNAWRERLEADPPRADVPEGLDATLRPYQVEGFRWLARMAHLGVGVCLADDMGLGKTVQALAAVLHRGGPSLVVAPTSVAGNWASEARRFAPSLQVLRFGQPSRDLHGLGSRDLVICTYGLLVSESDRFGAIDWRTIILDEAQAIKNPKTQRHKAARRLKADWRLTLTGTPIENRLGELRAQLDFLNRGLLGSEGSFRKRFARPIQQGSLEVTRQLRRLVRPLVLRRTKGEVLEDLPSKTEVTLRVDCDAETAAFYEALRQQAVASLEARDDAGHIEVIAHLTRLRLAACSPRLVEGGPAIDGPKLEAFDAFVSELEDGGHRALVFSQFVRHLGLLRERLDKRGTSYLYLDGSTPAKARQAAVDAFQGGQGRLFLISLKAGGTGLNLTAAETVLHVDPWWNPAAEDQASDRAHRIGQTRPVTVYRMVTRGTIEERIVKLHREKRDLADRFLSGTNAATSLSAEDLLDLLRDLSPVGTEAG